MAEVTFNIPKLFEDVFGVYTKVPVYFLGNAKPGSQPAKQDVEKYDLEQWKMAKGQYEYKSDKGVPMWDRFKFYQAPVQKDGTQIYMMPAATVAEVTDQVNMVQTELIGNDDAHSGTVKELMGEGDSIIIFRGFIFGKSNQYPVDEVKAFKEFCKVKRSVPVVSKLLNNAHDITDLVFKRPRFPEMRGFANVQAFEVEALSDKNIVLELS